MEIIGLKILDDFVKTHTDIKSQLQSWRTEVNENDWLTPNDIKQRYQTASFLNDNFVVFNIKGNNYRLVTKIDYQNKLVLIKRIGTHAEYTKWNLVSELK